MPPRAIKIPTPVPQFPTHFSYDYMWTCDQMSQIDSALKSCSSGFSIFHLWVFCISPPCTSGFFVFHSHVLLGLPSLLGFLFSKPHIIILNLKQQRTHFWNKFLTSGFSFVKFSTSSFPNLKYPIMWVATIDNHDQRSAILE